MPEANIGNESTARRVADGGTLVDPFMCAMQESTHQQREKTAGGGRLTALVTGSSGFLGRHLSSALESRGWRVLRCVRDLHGQASEVGSLELVALPDLDDASIARLPLDCDAIFHLDGLAHRYPPATPSEAEFVRVNAQGTRLLARAARGRAKSFVLVSSIAAVTSGSCLAITAETRPTPTTPYGRSKLEAEHHARCEIDGSTTSLRILRFPAIYGAHAPGAIAQLAAWIARGRPIPSGAGEARRSMIAVENAVDAMIVTASHPALDGVCAMPSDGLAPSILAVARMIAEAQGRALRVVPCPALLLRSLHRCSIPMTRIGVPALASLNRLIESCAISDDTLASRAGWTPAISTKDAIRSTFGGAA